MVPVIRPDATARRAAKHERYLREIRANLDDAKIVEMIARTISTSTIDFTRSWEVEEATFDASGNVTRIFVSEIAPIALARAVLDKLKSEGVVR